ncbi:hypothetical protein [Kitasatospora viridis]|uniref:Protein phosphatase 2C-like protein n=1 Tax=Kitasatospora viridis TaxID=281105 RepID=A0A561UMM3_9ACTN|nr:hypothetical protein [Kitasatospora viridis]TWG00625.1 hypothetical protein FHX73_114505 [Kitasatospora viridis]
MTDQGVPAPSDSADAWWSRVYEGPAGRLPDTPGAGGGDESVDEWFDSIAAVMGLVTPRRQEPVPVPVPAPVAVAPVPEVAQALPKVSLVKPTRVPPQRVEVEPTPHVGTRPPTYSPEPTLLPAARPERLAALVPDTALDGAQYPGLTLRAASVRGDSARYRGEPRTDALLLTRFGEAPDGLLLAVLGSRARAANDPRAGHTLPDLVPGDAIGKACVQLAEAIGRSRAELSADLRAGARDRLRYGLQRLTAGAGAALRASAAGGGSLHCLLIPLDPEATHRAAFGTGPGGLYLLRSGHWIDAYAARMLYQGDGAEAEDAGTEPREPRPFRFRMVPATAGDILLLASPGFAEPVAEEAAVGHFLATHWSNPHPPGTVDFLRQVQVRAKGHADDRTAIALWTG